MARNLGRYVAPVALLAVIVATVLVIKAGLGNDHHGAAVAQHRPHGALAGRTAHRRVFYVIQAGDSLSTISVKTHVPVPTLEALNPTTDPNALQTGQRLRLR